MLVISILMLGYFRDKMGAGHLFREYRLNCLVYNGNIGCECVLGVVKYLLNFVTPSVFSVYGGGIVFIALILTKPSRLPSIQNTV